MTIDVVVARFNEDMTWTKSLRRDCRLIVYDKGAGLDNPLENVGREAHTYFSHMVQHYHDFADWTFFTQGDPNRHMPFSHLQGIINGFPSTEFRSAFWQEGGPMFFVNQPVRFEGSDEGECQEKGVGELWQELFWVLPIGLRVFAPAAIFAISRDKLLTRSIRFYQEARSLAATRPRGPWEFERLWAYLWTSSAATKF